MYKLCPFVISSDAFSYKIDFCVKFAFFLSFLAILWRFMSDFTSSAICSFKCARLCPRHPYSRHSLRALPLYSRYTHFYLPSMFQVLTWPSSSSFPPTIVSTHHCHHLPTTTITIRHTTSYQPTTRMLPMQMVLFRR